MSSKLEENEGAIMIRSASQRIPSSSLLYQLIQFCQILLAILSPHFIWKTIVNPTFYLSVLLLTFLLLFLTSSLYRSRFYGQTRFQKTVQSNIFWSILPGILKYPCSWPYIFFCYNFLLYFVLSLRDVTFPSSIKVFKSLPPFIPPTSLWTISNGSNEKFNTVI